LSIAAGMSPPVLWEPGSQTLPCPLPAADRACSAAGALLLQEWLCSRLSAGNALHGRAAARAVVNFTVTGGETAQHPSGREEFAIPQLVWNKRSTFPSQVLNSNVLWSGMKHVCAGFLTLSVKVFVRACI